VPADNSLYEDLDDWWDPNGNVAGLHAMNPVRSGYALEVLSRELGPPDGTRVLDVGCGGGILVEALLRAGWNVVGVDAAVGALERASTHGREQGLETICIGALGERLPFPDDAFDAVMSSDFLEHVDDIGSVVRECARVLAPGAVFLFDAINRTWLTLLFHIGVLQTIRKLVPDGTHDWRQFVRPEELEEAMRAAGLQPIEMRGLGPAHPIRFGLRILFRRNGWNPMPRFRLGSSLLGSYIGYARKPRAITCPGVSRSSGQERRLPGP
jgi:2-polyprenyl-6-hydroxyphenyl methylase/3-demethylubiquinone-9 3-methyltransferase